MKTTAKKTVTESNADLNASIELARVRAYVKASQAPANPGTSQKVLEYTLRVKGIFGRNRSVKFKSFPLAVDQLGPLAQEELQVLVDAALADIGVKHAEVVVYKQGMNLEAAQYQPDGPVYISRTYECFSGEPLQTFNVRAGLPEDVMKAYAEAV